jgi:hypothetical protein
MQDLQRLQASSVIPANINTKYLDDLRHDFVVHPEMIEPVVQFCIQELKTREQNIKGQNENIMLISKL